MDSAFDGNPPVQLEVRGLVSGYGTKQVLFGLSLEIRAGEIVAIIGPNGSGKSTALKAIYGVIPVWDGDILYDGQRITGFSPAENIGRGISYAPQGHTVFSDLTVRENLEVGNIRLMKNKREERIQEVYKLFPILKEHASQQADKLSGGQQQMLSFARALISRPKILMLDEPSMGLSPGLVGNVFDKIRQINREIETTIVIVEQRVRQVLGLCKHVYALKLGRVAFHGLPRALLADNEKLKTLFL